MISFKETFGNTVEDNSDMSFTDTKLIDKNLGYFQMTNDQNRSAKTLNNNSNKNHRLHKTQSYSQSRKEKLNLLLNENLKLYPNEAQINNLLNSNNSDQNPTDQWWQLFDTKREKFFYYNPYQQRTIWQRPTSNVALRNKSIDQIESNSNDELTYLNEKENINNEALKQKPIVIPLASKLLERINANLNILKKSKRFMKLLKKKLDIDFKYDVNDLNIITTLTERLLNIQTILTKEETTQSSLTPSSSTSTFFDLSDLEMTSPISSRLEGSLSDSKLSPSNIPAQSNDSNSTLMTSLYSFQSLENNNTDSMMSGMSTAKRRLQPRTNPNYINVDLINTKNGSLIKNKYIKLQDLNNGISNNEVDNSLVISGEKSKIPAQDLIAHKNTFSTMSQAVLLLLSLLKSSKSIEKKTNKKSHKNNKPSEKPSIDSQSALVNTICSLNNIYLKVNNENSNDQAANCLSIGSSSATLISESSLNNTDISPNNNNNNNTSSHTTSRLGKKKLSTFKSTVDMSSFKNPTKVYSASLTKKNLDKNNVKLKTTLTSEFNNDTNNNNSFNSSFSPNSYENDFPNKQNSHEASTKPAMLSLFKRNTSSKENDEGNNGFDSPIQKYLNNQMDFNQNLNQSSPNPQSMNYKNTATVKSRKSSLNKELFTGSSSSSLADIRNISDNTQGPFNQRLQTFKRSFNKKTSFKKIKSPDVIFNNENAENRNNENLGQSHQFDLNASFESQRFPFSALDIIDSPAQTKKQSQTNLLLLNNTYDLNTSHRTRRIRNGFLLFSTKKKNPKNDLLVWTPQSIQKPLIKTNDKIVKKEACELFKLIQIYMGDRKLTTSCLPNINNTSTINRFPIQPIDSTQNSNGIKNNSTQEQTKLYHKSLICLEIMTKGWIYSQLRDELYIQLVKQTTDNPNKASLLLGWELMTICLSFFPPSQKLFPFLTEYIFLNLSGAESSEATETFQPPLDSSTSVESSFSIHLIDTAKKMRKNDDLSNKMAHTCLKRLERIHLTGAKKGLKKPTLEEILLSRQTIVSSSLFGTTLDEIMKVQESKCPSLTLPWIQTILSEAVLRLNGAKTEGIFRVPGDLDEVNNLKVRYDQLWCSRDKLSTVEDVQCFEDLMANIQDAHLPASLLKLWYRELYDPLIPNEFYEDCIKNCDKPKECINIVKRLPTINRLVFTHLIRFLKVFAANENVSVTKMDASNLSMIMAPNCLRCKSNEPKVIMENTKKEMQFMNTLIHNLDTS